MQPRPGLPHMLAEPWTLAARVLQAALEAATPAM